MKIACRCVMCKHVATFENPRDLPMCPKCYSPMVAERADSAVQRDRERPT